VTEAHLEDRSLISDDDVDGLQSWTRFSRIYQFNHVQLAVEVGCYCHSQPSTDEAVVVDLVKWLRYFCAAVMDHHCLQHIHIELKVHDKPIENGVLVKVLEPLQRLYGIKEVTLDAPSLSAATQASLKRTIQNAGPKNNLLVYGHYLHLELERVKKIVDTEAWVQEDGGQHRPLPPSEKDAQARPLPGRRDP